MQFFLKRILHTITLRPIWLLILIVPLILYIFIFSFLPHSYTVQKSLQIPASTPLALPSHPTKYIPLKQAVQKDTDKIFFSNYALSSLLKRIYINTDLNLKKPQIPALHKLVKKNAQFILLKDKTFQIQSQGANLEASKVIAGFYLEFVLDLARQGLDRQSKLSPEKAANLGLETLQSSKGTIQVHKGLNTPGRLLGLLIVFFFSLLFYLGAIIIIEVSDSSFKSERQAVQYLDLSLVGSIPDLNRISAAFNSSNTLKK